MLEEKIAVVTGASRGIGRAIAKELALKGAFVIVNYNGSKQAADETVNEITQAGGKAVGVQCNVADAAECEAFINNIISVTTLLMCINYIKELMLKSDWTALLDLVPVIVPILIIYFIGVCVIQMILMILFYKK